MKTSKLALSTVLGVLIAGCAGHITTVPYYYYARPGIPDFFQYAAAGRDFQTVIYGNPTAAPKDVFDAAVVAAMQRRYSGPTTNFTITPTVGSREGYRVVMAFGGDSYISGDAICGDLDPAAFPPATNGVELHAAFCFRDRLFSEVHVGTGAFSTPDDPRLEDAVAQAVLHLFPSYDPLRDGDDRRKISRR